MHTENEKTSNYLSVSTKTGFCRTAGGGGGQKVLNMSVTIDFFYGFPKFVIHSRYFFDKMSKEVKFRTFMTQPYGSNRQRGSGCRSTWVKYFYCLPCAGSLNGLGGGANGL